MTSLFFWRHCVSKEISANSCKTMPKEFPETLQNSRSLQRRPEAVSENCDFGCWACDSHSLFTDSATLSKNSLYMSRVASHTVVGSTTLFMKVVVIKKPILVKDSKIIENMGVNVTTSYLE